MMIVYHSLTLDADLHALAARLWSSTFPRTWPAELLEDRNHIHPVV
jgi:hypothetical protein